MALAILFLLVKPDSFSVEVILSESDHFSLEYGFIVHQNLLLPVTSFKFNFYEFFLFSLKGFHGDFVEFYNFQNFGIYWNNC